MSKPSLVKIVLLSCLAVTGMGLLLSRAGANPIIVATKVDTLVGDNDGDGNPSPGDIISYTITITNTGDMDAENVMFTDTIDTNTTLVGGSLSVSPIARHDFYDVLGNVGITVPDGASDLLANDNDPDGGAVTLTGITGCADTTAPFDCPAVTANGGDVTLNADGSFTYNPPPGFEGPDTFEYEVTDDEGDTDLATVEFTVSGMIWFVDASSSAGGDGTLSDPFDNLAGAGNSFDALAADDPGDSIFVADDNYTGGLTLLNNQRLIGDGSSGDLAIIAGVSAPVFSNPLPIFSGIDPIITSSANGVNLGSGNRVQGLTIGNTPPSSYGLAGNSVGSLTVTDATINGTGCIMDLNSGTVALDFNGLASTNNCASTAIDLTALGAGSTLDSPTTSISSGGGAGINVSSTASTGSAFDFGVTNVSLTGGSGTGIDLSTGNSNASFTFDALTVNTNNGTGLLANNSGTVNIGGSSNSITATGGPALNVVSTSSGSGWTFASLISTNSGSEGINLDTISGGTITVTGLTDINNPVTEGIELENSAISFSFQDVTIDNQGSTAIFIDNVDGTSLTFRDVNLTTPDPANGNGIRVEDSTTAVTFASTDVNNNSSHGISLANNTGSFTITGAGPQGNGGTIQGSTLNGIDMSSVSNISLTGVTVQNNLNNGIFGSSVTNFDLVSSTVQNNTNAINEAGIHFNNLLGTASIYATTVSGSTEHNVDILNSSGTLTLLTVRNSTIQNNSAGLGADGIFVGGITSAVMNVVVEDSTFNNNQTDGIQADVGNNAVMDFRARRNSFTNGNIGLNVTSSGSAQMTFEIDNNTAFSGNGSFDMNIFAGNSSTMHGEITNNDTVNSGEGVRIIQDVDSTLRVLVDDNTFNASGFGGALTVRARDGSGRLDATITDNVTTATGGGTLEGIFVDTRTNNTVCADIRGNTASSAGADDILVEKASGTSTFILPGIVSPFGTAQAISLLSGQNTVTTVDAILSGGTFSDGTCNLPVVQATPQLQPDQFVEAQPESVESMDNGYTNEVMVASADPFTRPNPASADLVALTTLVENNDQAISNLKSPIPNLQSRPAGLASPLRSGENFSIDLGTLNPGQLVTIEFQVTIDDPLVPVSTTQVCNQATITATGLNAVTDDPDTGAPDDATCTTIAVDPGTIIIQKVTDPGGATEPFTFTTNITPSLVFTLIDGQTQFFANVGVGTYTVTEAPPTDGYSLSNIECDDGASATPSTGSVGSRSATINLDRAEDVTCTFTNTVQNSDLSIVKTSTRNNDEPPNGVMTYTLTVGNAGPTGASGVIVSDPIPTGVANFTQWTCAGSGGVTCPNTNGSGAINETAGSFPMGGQLLYTIRATLVSSNTTVTNTATVTTTTGLGDPQPDNNRATDTSTPSGAPGTGIIYLPIITKNFSPSSPLPDLSIDSFIVSSNQVTITVRNAGNASVVDAFWVQIVFGTAPTGVNQRWDTLSSQGALWGVVSPGIPLAPNATLTLNLNDIYFYNGNPPGGPANNVPNPIPVGSTVYVQLDAINYATTYGNVLESNEGNNIDVITSIAGFSVIAPARSESGLPSSEGLPALAE